VAPRRRGGRRTRRLGTILLVVGVLAVLGGAFVVGALAGRFSLRPASVATAKSADRGAKPAPSTPPELTFYRELTAPLVPPPLPPKPAAKSMPGKREGPPAPPSEDKRAPTVEAPRTVGEPTAPPRAAAGRYTVQVGSYTVRAQAEAVRARLAAAGHEAYVAEGEAAGTTRYRVRVGAFPTADEARHAAVRLASQAQVATYVTTR
jgi:cell division protein FtsN